MQIYKRCPCAYNPHQLWLCMQEWCSHTFLSMYLPAQRGRSSSSLAWFLKPVTLVLIHSCYRWWSSTWQANTHCWKGTVLRRAEPVQNSIYLDKILYIHSRIIKFQQILPQCKRQLEYQQNFMQVHWLLHRFCTPQNCPLPVVTWLLNALCMCHVVHVYLLTQFLYTICFGCSESYWAFGAENFLHWAEPKPVHH